jgi:RNA polymerase sigma factor, sigma-70 family/RNA polymerase sigma factor, TIGR02999 family
MVTSPTLLVQRAASGDAEAMRALFASLYPDIKRLARSKLAQAGGVTGLNATALVHEGFMRMAEREGLQGQTRLQFFAYVGKVLRSIVIDTIRERQADKRGAGLTLMTLSAADDVPAPWLDVDDLVALDEALEQLQQLDPRLYQVVELHVFSGLTLPEVAQEIGVNLRTINRDLVKARALLFRALGHSEPTAAGRPVAGDQDHTR